MVPTRRTLLQASALGLAGSIAGCAGANENRQDAETTAETTTGATEEGTDATGQPDLPFTVAVTTHPERGVILTDSEGMTLYRFTQDEDGENTCYDDCAEAWPPLTAEESPTIPDGLPGEFGTTERDDGSMQVTYGGMPLYYWQGDEEPGDATGHGVNDVWFVANPSCPGSAGSDDSGTTSEPTTTPETTTEEDDGGNGGGPDY